MTRAPIRWELLPLVCAGGAIGVAARHVLTALVPDGSVVWMTAVINVVGSLLLGFVAGVCGARHARWRGFLGTGVLGGFTTYSAFAVQVAGATGGPQIALVLAGSALLVILSVGAALAGLVVGARVARGAAA